MYSGILHLFQFGEYTKTTVFSEICCVKYVYKKVSGKCIQIHESISIQNTCYRVYLSFHSQCARSCIPQINRQTLCIGRNAYTAINLSTRNKGFSYYTSFQPIQQLRMRTNDKNSTDGIKYLPIDSHITFSIMLTSDIPFFCFVGSFIFIIKLETITVHRWKWE